MNDTPMMEWRRSEALRLFKALTVQMFPLLMQAEGDAQDLPLSAVQEQLCNHFVNEVCDQGLRLQHTAGNTPAKDAVAVTSDAYDFELLSMIASLCGTSNGAKHIGLQGNLLQSLFLHITHASARNQHLVLIACVCWVEGGVGG